MDAIGMLSQQFRTVNTRLHHVGDALDPELLPARVAPAANPVGFLLWHLVRSQDWAIHTAVRGVQEVVAREDFAGSSVDVVPGMGTGFTAAQVDQVSRAVELQTLLVYADAVHAEALSWLGTLDERDLDALPDVAGHLAAHPAYQRPEFLAEMGSGPEHDAASEQTGGLPTWLLLTSVSVTHLHRHLGEVDLTLGVLTGRPG